MFQWSVQRLLFKNSGNETVMAGKKIGNPKTEKHPVVDNGKASERSYNDGESVILFGIYEALNVWPFRFQFEGMDVSR